MRPGERGRVDSKPRKWKVHRVKKRLTRKERRKQERSLKKKKAAAFFHSKRSNVELSSSRPASGQDPRNVVKKKSEKVDDGKLKSKNKSKWKRKTGDSDLQANVNKIKQTAAVMREEREIARLEKLLKMKKRKKLPSLFKEEGLDYLLDLTDKNSSEWNLSSEESDTEEIASHQQESESEPEEAAVRISRPRHNKQRLDLSSTLLNHKVTSPQKGILKDKKEAVTSQNRRNKKDRNEKRVRFSMEGDLPAGESSDENADACGLGEGTAAVMEFDDDLGGGGNMKEYSDTDDFDDFEDLQDSIDSNEELELGSDDGYMETESSGEEDEEGESVDGASIEAVTSTTGNSSTYVPPHLRERRDSKSLEKLRKTVQGLINRLSESNIQSISTQLEQMYRENSRNDMNSTLSEVLLKSCVSPFLLSDRFALEHMMLVALLHHRVGQEVGAHVVQSLTKKLGLLLGDQPHYGNGKECDCVVLMLGHLYNYRVIHCLLIYDIIRKLVESFRERDVELLLLLLKSTGMEIRRDDAASLKEIILQIQSKAVSSNLTNSSRMRFMLDTIAALRTNNARKIPNYDPSLLEHMKKLLRGLVHSSGSLDDSQLKISLQDLLNADTHGRWWVVGSAWVGRETNSTSSVGGGVADVGGATSSSESWVLELAQRQRMNTDVKKNIFCVIMTSEDYVDAFEKLLKLSLKEVQEREIIHVLVDCCLQEKHFNPFYAHLGQKFCEFKRSHQVTFQYALWDRFKTLESLTVSNRSNLRKLVCHLVSAKSLSLSILKVVEFGELEEGQVKFYKTLLKSLLSNNSDEEVTAIFSRLAPLPSLKTFRTELILFIKHFLGSSSSQEVATRIKLAEQAMKAQGHIF